MTATDTGEPLPSNSGATVEPAGNALRTQAQSAPSQADSAQAVEIPKFLPPDETVGSLGLKIVRARLRAGTRWLTRFVFQRTLRIGVSARIFHPEPGASGLQSKNLQYLEESVARWVLSRDALVFMIPTLVSDGLMSLGTMRLRDYARHLDGLVLQGGADISPMSYSSTPTRPEWSGDRTRDMYELELLHAFVDEGKPVLGICRGCQLINVAFGGTLYQDIAMQVSGAIPHVHQDYDRHRHAVAFVPGTLLGALFGIHAEASVNSIHHQAVRELGRDVLVEAVSPADGIIEAVRYRRAPFVLGLQWHPEFHRQTSADLLDCTAVLDAFLRAARETRF